MAEILVVEDDEDDRWFLLRALRRAGYDGPVLEAVDGMEAIERLRPPFAVPEGRPPGLLILDLKLPKRTGLEVLAWVRAHPDLRAVRIVVLTSSDEESDRRQAVMLGVDDYFVKPLNEEGLIRLAQQILGGWESRTPRG